MLIRDGGIRLIPYNVLTGPDVILELGPGSARLVNEQGVINLNASGQLILNNDFSGGSTIGLLKADMFFMSG